MCEGYTGTLCYLITSVNLRLLQDKTSIKKLFKEQLAPLHFFIHLIGGKNPVIF